MNRTTTNPSPRQLALAAERAGQALQTEVSPARPSLPAVQRELVSVRDVACMTSFSPKRAGMLLQKWAALRGLRHLGNGSGKRWRIQDVRKCIEQDLHVD